MSDAVKCATCWRMTTQGRCDTCVKGEALTAKAPGRSDESIELHRQLDAALAEVAMLKADLTEVREQFVHLADAAVHLAKVFWR